MRLAQLLGVIVALAPQNVISLAVPQSGSLTLPLPVSRNNTSQVIRNGTDIITSVPQTTFSWAIDDTTVLVQATIQLNKPIYKPDVDAMLELAIKQVSSEDSAQNIADSYICHDPNHNAIFEYRPDHPSQDLTWGELNLLIASIQDFFKSLEPRVPIVNTYVMTTLSIWTAGGGPLGHASVSEAPLQPANDTISATKAL